jgi:hypothetical protein
MRALFIAYMTGAAGQSVGLFYIGDGTIAGVDVGGMQYDGKYVEGPDGALDAVVDYIIPPNTPIISGFVGAAQPAKVTLQLRLPPNFWNGQVIPVSAPTGQVNAKFEKLKELP